MTLQPGQNLAHYRLLELIGEGGMGRVFRALDGRLHRQVAIKILQPALTADPKLRRRFMREARAAAAVSHPAIASIHEVGEAGDITYIVMEFVDGKTLRRTIDGQPVPLTEALRVAVEIAEGLSEAHKAGVIHRDLKPDNIIIRPDRRPKILDFGIAKLLEGRSSLFRRKTTASDTTSITGEGKIVGTLGYMSPEQARGEPVDARSDVFSFGVILYEMVAGQAPFRGRTPIDTLTSILKEPPPPVATFNPKVHPRVEEVLRQCLDKDPACRFQTMEDVVVALRIAQLALQEAALRRTTVEHAALQEPLSSPEGREEAPARRKRSVPARAAAAGGVAAVVLALALGLLLYGRREDPPPPGPGAGGPRLSMAVMGFENLSDPDDRENLGRSLAGLITTGLAEQGGLKMASTAKVMSALRKAGAGGEAAFDTALASAAARYAGAEVMLLGQVTSAGEGMILTAEIVDVKSGNTLGSLRREAGSGQALIGLADAIADDVRKKLGVEGSAPEGAGDLDLARALTGSAAAWRHYTAGQVELNQARWREAVREFESAVAEDPTFALAYYRQAMALKWLGRAREVRETLEAGLPHLGRLPPRWRTLYGATLQWTRGEHRQAYEKLVALADAEPDLPDVHYLLGELHTHRSRYYDMGRARQEFQKTLDLDPSYKVVFNHLVYHHLDAGDLESAEDLIARARDQARDDAAVAEAEVALLFAQGDLEVAITLGEEAMKRGHRNVWLPLATMYRYTGRPAKAYRLAVEAAERETDVPAGAMIIRAAAASDMGRLREAIETYEEASAMLTASGSYERYRAAAHVARARLLAATGNLSGAEAAARSALQADPYYAPGFFWLGRLLLQAGKTDQARQVLEELRRMRQAALSPAGVFWERVLQAEVHMEEGDLGSALQELGKAARLAPEQRSLEVEWMTQARVKEAFGDLAAAEEAWRECLRPRVQNVSEVNMATPLPYFELARVEERLGNEAGAREQYRRFLSRWGETDLPVAASQEARSRLKALGPGGGPG